MGFILCKEWSQSCRDFSQCSYSSFRFEVSHDAWPQSGILLHAFAPALGVDGNYFYITLSHHLSDHLLFLITTLA